MKRLLVIGISALAFASAADAACTKKALNGTWTMNLGAVTGFGGTMSAGTWQYVIDANTSYTVTVSSLSKTTCKGLGTYAVKSGGTTTTFPARFAVEHIDASSANKPNILHMTADAAPPTSYTFYLQRR